MSNHIFAIGIDSYKNCSKLNNAVRDIDNIVNTLTTKYDFDKSNVTKLLNERATLENITNELENYLTSQDESQNLIILFSGHGEFDDLLQMGYLIPQEAQPYSKSTYLPYSTLFSYIKALKSHHILLISDSCFSGSIFTPYRKIETSKEKLDKIPSKWAITSGRIEPVSDGEPGKNSPFAEALIDVLENNNTKSLSISELSNRIVSEVAEKVDQIPRGEPLQSYGHKGGEFIFTRKTNNKTIKSKKDEVYSEREELLKLIDSNYEIEEKIEEAENENKTGTIRRLTKEKESLTNILNKELLKELEIQKGSVSQNMKNEDTLPKNYIEKSDEIIVVRKKKTLVVKNQKYDEAAVLRDKEIKLEKELRAILNEDQILEKLELSTESLYSDYFISQLIMNTQPGIKFDKRDVIEKTFGRLLFFDLSFKSGKISPFIYKDTRVKLVEILKIELNKTISNNN